MDGCTQDGKRVSLLDMICMKMGMLDIMCIVILIIDDGGVTCMLLKMGLLI